MIKNVFEASMFVLLLLVGLACVFLVFSPVAFGQVGGTASGIGYPAGSTPLLSEASGTTTATTATLASAPGRINFLCGFHVETGTATTAIPVNVTTAGLSATFTSSANAPATAATATAGPIISQVFTPCLQATGANTAVSVTASALGAGGVNQIVNAWGYQVPLN